METKTQKLNRLFEQWEASVPDLHGRFVKDGIIEDDFFENASTKLLFVAKEPNNPEQKPGDFRIWWRNVLENRFSFRIAEWSYGVLNSFPEFTKRIENSNSLHSSIRSIAFMNMKKTGGLGNSQYSSLMSHINRDIDFLRTQVEIISPEVVITGLTWKEPLQLLFPDVRWINCGFDVNIGRHGDFKIIDFYHPSARIPGAASYSLLSKVFESKRFQDL